MKKGPAPTVLERTRDRLSLAVRDLRRAIAKAIEPPDPARAPKWQVPIEICDSLLRTEPSEFVHRATVRDIKAGDFVLAYGDLGEVIDAHDSQYGYRSYQVRYLAEKPLPAIQEDWFPAFYVQRLYTREEFLQRLHEMVMTGHMPASAAEMMGRMTVAQLQPLVRAALTDTWWLGLREWVRGQQ